MFTINICENVEIKATFFIKNPTILILYLGTKKQ